MFSCKWFSFTLLFLLDLLNSIGLIGIDILLEKKDVLISPIMIVITDFILSSSRFLVLLYLINNPSCFRLMHFQYIAILFNITLRIGTIIYFFVLMYDSISDVIRVSYFALIFTSFAQLTLLTIIQYITKPERPFDELI